MKPFQRGLFARSYEGLGQESGQKQALGPGAFLAEMALITGEPRSAAVSALRETQVLTLDIADLRALAGQHPALTQAIEAEAARRRGGSSDTE